MRDPLARRAVVTPDRVAVIEPEGSTCTFAALDDEITELAGRIADYGISSGDHLGTLLTEDRAAFSLVHAAMRLGCPLVPLNPKLDGETLSRHANQADVTLLVCDDATAEAAASIDGPRVVSVEQSEPVPTLAEASVRSVTPCEWALSDRLLLLFTSGTTGDPKAVTLTMGNVLSSAAASATRLGVLPDDRWLSPLPPYHMGGVAPYYRSAFSGTAVVLPGRTEPASLATTAHREAVTGASLVPTMLKRLLETPRGLPDSLRFVLLGGGRIPPTLVETALDQDVPVYPTYGLTEAASQVTTATPEEAADNPETVGRPLVVTQVTVVDESGTPVGAGAVGEIVVDGPTVTPGYYGDPDATAAAVGPHGFHTGDRGFLDAEGRLTIKGRRDDRIVTGGENVDPRAVVDVIRSLSGVADAVVVGIPDPEWGERVGALMVREPDANVTADTVDASCRTALADFERPRSLAFVESLPRTPSGTVDREAARRLLLDAN